MKVPTLLLALALVGAVWGSLSRRSHTTVRCATHAYGFFVAFPISGSHLQHCGSSSTGEVRGNGPTLASQQMFPRCLG